MLLIVIFLSCTSFSHGFADWFTKDYCSRKLFVGQVIMNNKALASEERFVRVFRGTKELKSGDVYQPSESLTVSINEVKGQHVYEVSEGGAKFEKGGCEGRRIADKPKVTLVMPAKGAATASEFEIIIGWATGHEAVNISPAFRLISAESMTHHDTPKVATNDIKSKSKLNTLSGKSRKKLDEENEEEDQKAVHALFEHESEVNSSDKEQMLIEEEEGGGEHEHDTVVEDGHVAVKDVQEEEEHGDLHRHHHHLPHDAQDHHLSDALPLSHEVNEGSKQQHAASSSDHDEVGDHAPKHAPEVEEQQQHQREDKEHRHVDHLAHDHSGGDSVHSQGILPPVIPKKTKTISAAAASSSSHELEELHSLADHIHHLDEQHNKGQQGVDHVENGHAEEDHSHHRNNHVDDHKEQGGHERSSVPESLSSIFHRERAEDTTHEHDNKQHVDNTINTHTHDHKENVAVHGRPSELHDSHNHHDNNQHQDNHEPHDNHEHHDNSHHDLKIQHERENDFQGFHEEEDHHHHGEEEDHHHHGDIEQAIHDSHHERHEHIIEEHNPHDHHPHLPGAIGGEEGIFPDPSHHNVGLGLGLEDHPSPFAHAHAQEDHFNRLHDQLQGDHMIQPPPPHHELMGQIHAEAVRQHGEQLMVLHSEAAGHDSHDDEQEGEELKKGNHHNPLHHITDQFHHKFGVPGKEEEFREKHHKYKIVNSNINKDKNPNAASSKGHDDEEEEGHATGPGSTTKRVINALGAKAAATMKTMTKLRGGPRASARGHGLLGYVTLWEWLGLAAAAMLIFGLSRVVANRHKLKRYVLRKQGYDLDK